jgi:drug/metabolite transporter (DMT)-like permease
MVIWRMEPIQSPRHAKALTMLIVATVFWGLSFPVMKSLNLLQQQLVPGSSSWFVTTLTVSARFGLAGFLVLGACIRTIRLATRLEWSQGLGLAIFGSIGLIFQTDGLAYTSASTSAFLTQGYCLLLPGIVAIRDRRRPSGVLLLSCVLMIVGIGILAEIDPRKMQLGRGEIETLLASLLFTGQILWLERPKYAENNVNHFSTIMFFGTALVALPLALMTMHQPGDFIVAFGTPATWLLTAILVLPCTMLSYMLMNHWQRHVPAAEAGLIYGVEPVFATLFALFLPQWISKAAGLNYENETATTHLLIGGGLILLANIIIQVGRRGH